MAVEGSGSDSLRATLAALPKGDRHNHLCLCVNRRSLLARYGRGPDFPATYDGLPGMIDFIHAEVNAVMATADDVEAFMEMAIRDSLGDGVLRLEASVDINLTRYFDGSIDRLLGVVAGLKSRYETFRPIIGINKPTPIEDTNWKAAACMESGLFSGIDLYGPEADQDLSKFVSLYRAARKRGLNLKVHIGEFSDAATIVEAIELLEPDELQHGIRAHEEAKAIEAILKNDIMLNVCPASNVSLGAVRDLRSHPIRKLFDLGVKISINPDDLLLFDATITDQYLALLEAGIFSFEEIQGLRLNGLGD
jgi:adenosine deaminase